MSSCCDAWKSKKAPTTQHHNRQDKWSNPRPASCASKPTCCAGCKDPSDVPVPAPWNPRLWSFSPARWSALWFATAASASTSSSLVLASPVRASSMTGWALRSLVACVSGYCATGSIRSSIARGCASRWAVTVVALTRRCRRSRRSPSSCSTWTTSTRSWCATTGRWWPSRNASPALAGLFVCGSVQAASRSCTSLCNFWCKSSHVCWVSWRQLVSYLSSEFFARQKSNVTQPRLRLTLKDVFFTTVKFKLIFY